MTFIKDDKSFKENLGYINLNLIIKIIKLCFINDVLYIFCGIQLKH